MFALIKIKKSIFNIIFILMPANKNIYNKKLYLIKIIYYLKVDKDYFIDLNINLSIFLALIFFMYI